MKNINLSKQEILNRIGYFRNKKNISAYKLGLELGHAKTYFYRVESGEIELTIELLLDTLEILGVTTAEFFCPFIDDESLEILEDIIKLNSENKSTIKELIKKLK